MHPIPISKLVCQHVDQIDVFRLCDLTPKARKSFFHENSESESALFVHRQPRGVYADLKKLRREPRELRRSGMSEHATVQAETNKQETDLSSVAGASSARVFATLGLRMHAKNAIRPWYKKSFRKIESEGGGLRPFQNEHSKSHCREARTWTKPQPKSFDFEHLIVPNSKGEPNPANSLSLTARVDFDADWHI